MFQYDAPVYHTFSVKSRAYWEEGQIQQIITPRRRASVSCARGLSIVRFAGAVSGLSEKCQHAQTAAKWYNPDKSRSFAKVIHRKRGKYVCANLRGICGHIASCGRSGASQSASSWRRRQRQACDAAFDGGLRYSPGNRPFHPRIKGGGEDVIRGQLLLAD